MSTQLQRRRGTKAENDLFNGAEGEFIYDTDTKRARTYDGSTVGGVPLPTYLDSQNNAFTAADAVGTDTITLDLEYAPSAYAEYQKFTFKPQANNTGAVTLNVNGLGAKNLKKHNGDGTYDDLEADDLILGVITDVVYNGTEFVLDIGGGGGGGAVWSDTITVTGLSGTPVLIDTIPEGVTEVEVRFFSVSYGGTSQVRDIVLQIGDSGGYLTSGYSSQGSSVGFNIFDEASATQSYSGRIVLTKVDNLTNEWYIDGYTTKNGFVYGYNLNLTDFLTSLRLRVYTGATANGTVDSGTADIRYR